MEIQIGGGVFELGNPEVRGGSSSFGNPGGRGGGSKNRAFRRGGVDFFWNNPIHTNNLKTLKNLLQFFTITIALLHFAHTKL